MPTNPLTPQEMRDAVLAVAKVCMEPGFTHPKQPGTKSAMEEAARRLGMKSSSTLAHRVMKAIDTGQVGLGSDCLSLSCFAWHGQLDISVWDIKAGGRFVPAVGALRNEHTLRQCPAT